MANIIGPVVFLFKLSELLLNDEKTYYFFQNFLDQLIVLDDHLEYGVTLALTSLCELLDRGN